MKKHVLNLLLMIVLCTMYSCQTDQKDEPNSPSKTGIEDAYTIDTAKIVMQNVKVTYPTGIVVYQGSTDGGKTYHDININTRWYMCPHIQTNLYEYFPNITIYYGEQARYKGYSEFEGYNLLISRKNKTDKDFYLDPMPLYLPNCQIYMNYQDFDLYLAMLEGYDEKIERGEGLTRDETKAYNYLVNALTENETEAKQYWEGRIYVEINGSRYYVSTCKFKK